MRVPVPSTACPRSALALLCALWAPSCADPGLDTASTSAPHLAPPVDAQGPDAGPPDTSPPDAVPAWAWDGCRVDLRALAPDARSTMSVGDRLRLSSRDGDVVLSDEGCGVNGPELDVNQTLTIRLDPPVARLVVELADAEAWDWTLAVEAADGERWSTYEDGPEAVAEAEAGVEWATVTSRGSVSIAALSWCDEP